MNSEFYILHLQNQNLFFSDNPTIISFMQKERLTFKDMILWSDWRIGTDIAYNSAANLSSPRVYYTWGFEDRKHHDQTHHEFTHHRIHEREKV